MKKLRIGILIKDFKKLRNFELRIVQGILEHPDLELALLIRDGRSDNSSLPSVLRRKLLTAKAAANILFAVQTKIESLIYSPHKITVDAGAVISRLGAVPVVSLCPERKGFLDIFSKEDAGIVSSYGLDIILRHEFGIIRGDILEAARYGIWSFHHADNAVNRGTPPAFWEIMNNEPCFGVTLQRLTPELDGGQVIEKAWFSCYRPFHRISYLKNYYEMLEKSVTLLFKNIDKLLKTGKLETTASLTYCNRLYRNPNLCQMIKYLIKFYSGALALIPGAIRGLRRVRPWALFFGKGNFMEAALFRIKPIDMPKGEFWADPFLFRYDGRICVFFEVYPYKTKTGKISCGVITEEPGGKYKISGVQDVLNTGCHMSYPQIVQEDGEIYMIPETKAAKRLEIYRCVDFPGKWELFNTAFEGEEIVDTTYYQDAGGSRWLFQNKGRASEAELYIYKIDSLKLKSIIAHENNPVIIDCRKGRNAGEIFKYNGEYYRPGQINTYGNYGRGLQINKVLKLTLDEFADEPVMTVEPEFRKGLIGMHHLHQIDGCFIFDARFK